MNFLYYKFKAIKESIFEYIYLLIYNKNPDEGDAKLHFDQPLTFQLLGVQGVSENTSVDIVLSEYIGILAKDNTINIGDCILHNLISLDIDTIAGNALAYGSSKIQTLSSIDIQVLNTIYYWGEVLITNRQPLDIKLLGNSVTEALANIDVKSLINISINSLIEVLGQAIIQNTPHLDFEASSQNVFDGNTIIENIFQILTLIVCGLSQDTGDITFTSISPTQIEITAESVDLYNLTITLSNAQDIEIENDNQTLSKILFKLYKIFTLADYTGKTLNQLKNKTLKEMSYAQIQ